MLRKRKELRKGWYIVRRDETSLITSLGEVVYHKTLFKNTSTGESWKKNGFVETGATNETDKYTVVVARRGLQ